MKRSGVCLKCEGTEIVTAKAIDQGHNNSRRQMEVSTFEHPNAWVFKGERSTTLSAYVCLRCGFIEYYADDPTALVRED
jgi:predicted nucleic-acid-binding Zn-ribbon protein